VKWRVSVALEKKILILISLGWLQEEVTQKVKLEASNS
jgi:hypothetical protein